MKILITGAGSFIGKNLFDQLKNFYSLQAANRRQLDLFDSKKVYDFIKKNQFDVIIHTATYDAAARFSPNDKNRVLENNLKMFFNVVRAQDYFKKMIYFGSGAEFGRDHWKPKMRESYFDAHVPTDQYGLSKYIMGKYAQLNNKIYNLRLFGVFGKYDDWKTRLIPNLCCRALFNQSIKIKQNRLFDFIYIDDLVKIVKWFIEHKPRQNIYNVCSGTTIDFKTIAKKIIKISGNKSKLVIGKKGRGVEYGGDNKLLRSEIKNLEFTPINTSLKYLYNWYDSNKEIIKISQL